MSAVSRFLQLWSLLEAHFGGLKDKLRHSDSEFADFDLIRKGLDLVFAHRSDTSARRFRRLRSKSNKPAYRSIAVADVRR